MTASHRLQACSILKRVIERIGDEGRHFTGVMKSGFFATFDGVKVIEFKRLAVKRRHFTLAINSGLESTSDGVKVIEFNARFGDPECMNIMSLFSGSWPELMERLSGGGLRGGDVPLAEEASLVLYLVSP